MHGVIIIKTNGEAYLMRNPGDGDYSLEKIERKYIVDSYVPISPYGRSYCIDIMGNLFVVE